MNNKLVDLMRSMLKEELKPLNDRFDNLENRFDGLENRFDNLETRFDGLGNRIDGFETRFDGLENRIDGLETRFDGLGNRIDGLESDIKEIKEGQKQLQKNIVNSLGEYTDRIIDHFDNTTAALNKRVFIVEADIQKILKSKQ